MKRFGWVVFVVACGHKSPALPVAEPAPIAEMKPVPLDAAMPDAPDPAVVAAAEQEKARVEREQALAAAHEQCTSRAKAAEADLPTYPPPKPRKGTPRATAELVSIGAVSDRYPKKGTMPIEGPWDGEPMRKKLVSKLGPLTACYAQALKRDPDLIGGITLGADLNEDGTLTDVRGIENEVVDYDLEECLKTKIGKLRIPGGSKDAFGFEAYFEFAFCPADQGVCILALGAQGQASWSNRVRTPLNHQLQRMAACYRAAGKSHVHGVLEAKTTIDREGGVTLTRSVGSFVGDDHHGTAQSAANTCASDALRLVCAKTAPLDESAELAMRLWFQR